MTVFRWICALVGLLCVMATDFNSQSAWESAGAPFGFVLCFFAFLLSFPLQKYRQNPRQFAIDAAEARRKANERGSSYDGGMD